MPVEQATCDQLTLHLAKLLTNLPPLGGVRLPLLKLSLSELAMAKVRRRDPCSTFFGLCTSAGAAMEAAAAVFLIGRTLTNGAPTRLRAASLPRPIGPEPPLNTDGHIVFCQHEQHPAYGVLLYRKLIGVSREVELAYGGKSRGSRTVKLGALSAAKVSFGQASKCE
jgi:hypothetical protein